MSGICGIINLDGVLVRRAELELMANKAACRGLDGIAYHCDGPVGIACLSLDTTPDGTGACRPVVEPRYGLVFAADARLDNRDACACAGVSPHLHAATATDAELMLGMLLHAGEEGPGRLLGDFSYVLWDASRSKLHLARDAMGMRTLYYRLEPGRLLFASEARQILALKDVPRRLNSEAVGWHLCGMQTPPGQVFYEGIEELKPAEEVVIDLAGRKRSRCFWTPDPERRLRYPDERDYADQLRELLTEAVRCRLRARDPVGVSLSGGVDSTSVASVAGWLRQQGEAVPSMRAYSWVFSELTECDERENIYRIADHFGMPVHEVPAEETYPLVEDSLNQPHEDDPFFSMFLPFLDKSLSAAAADRVSVMFYGFRGDVMCGGNVNDVPGMLLAGHLREGCRELSALSEVFSLSWPSTLSRYLMRPILADALGNGALAQGWRTARRGYRSGRGKGGAVAYPLPRGPVRRAAEHISPAFLQQVGLPPIEPVRAAAATWQRSAPRDRYIHIFSPLVTRGITYAERVAAMHGVGLADPWSDRRIAEFILACPQYCVDTAIEGKRLARRAMEGVMPADAIRSIGKVSPEPLYLGALRNKAYHKVIDLMTHSRCAELGFVDEAMLRERFERFVRGEAPSFDLWPTLSLEIWLRRFW
ncbi:asparagine synthetase B family protein [Halomonas sp. A29]|uniref:asparagine synthetase B family protein n=1 Tax=Halomonas sp. A29 TaxID=3102786 RepID=UPI00398A9895